MTRRGRERLQKIVTPAILFIVFFIIQTQGAPAIAQETPLDHILQEVYPFSKVHYHFFPDGRVQLDNDKITLTFLPKTTLLLVNQRLVALSEEIHFEGSSASIAPGDELALLEALRGPNSPTPSPFLPPAGPLPRAPRKILTVVIDPGHGGKFEGTSGPRGLKEKTLNLDLALRLQKYLSEPPKNNGPFQFHVVLTRTTDQALSNTLSDDLQTRVDQSINSRADLFLSIHNNYSDNSKIHGFEIYMPTLTDWLRKKRLLDDPVGRKILLDKGGVSPWSYLSFLKKKTQDIALDLEKEMDNTDIPSRGIHTKSLHVLRENLVPAVLIEVDYLSHPHSEAELLQEEHRQKIAEAIGQAIINYFNQEIS